MDKDNRDTQKARRFLRVTRTIVFEGPEDWVDEVLRSAEDLGPCLVPKYGDRRTFSNGGEVRCTMRTDSFEGGDR